MIDALIERAKGSAKRAFIHPTLPDLTPVQQATPRKKQEIKGWVPLYNTKDRKK